MKRSEKLARLKAMLSQVAPDGKLANLTPPAAVPAPTEVSGGGVRLLEFAQPRGLERAPVSAAVALQKMRDNREGDIDENEMLAIEAIIMPEVRPVTYVRNGTYDELRTPWTHLNDAGMRERINPMLGAVGRIELPGLPQYPYGGTGFVVGRNLLMTNRHVARLFTDGLGIQRLIYRSGDAAVDFRREKGMPDGRSAEYFSVVKVEMIHPYWDMALLRVAGLEERVPLSLSVDRPEDMVDRDVVVVGYPARDDRNDLDVQDKLFERTYNVKRLQPGKLRQRAAIHSFEQVVNSVTHDSSTLGGNSGSAVIDPQTEEVVALHFAGLYLKANYGVPTYELARDGRVVDAGVNFSGRVEPTNEWEAAWRRAGDESARTAVAPGFAPTGNGTNGGAGGRPDSSGTVALTVPLHITIRLGTPADGDGRGAAVTPVPVAPTEAAMQVPVIYDGLEDRTGYRPDFLELGSAGPVPLPALTAKGRGVVAKLDDGTAELRYHKFSVVMHKGRRLALYTAANVDWRRAERLINGRKPTRGELTGIPENVREQWVTDWRIPEKHQLPDTFYTKDGGAFDKGHLVRRDDVCWGKTFEDMQKANGDTYHTTNCSPQTREFNQAPYGDENWGDLENLVQAQTKAEKAIVFSGPVLAANDRLFVGRGETGEVRLRIPRRFWKVIVVKGATGPQAFGFVLEQDLSQLPRGVEFAVPAQWQRHTRTIPQIEELLNGLVKLPWLRQHDAIASSTEESVRIQAGLAAVGADN